MSGENARLANPENPLILKILILTKGRERNQRIPL